MENVSEKHSTMKRVIFVGLHNKPGMKPLDSKTKSGKLIDRIIEKCRRHGMSILKTNLFDVDYLPSKDQMPIMSFEWIERVELYKGDVIVLLGAMTHKYFPKLPSDCNSIKVAHPTSKRSYVEMYDYVEKTFDLIKLVSPDG